MVDKILRPDAVPADNVLVEYKENAQSMTPTSPVNTQDDVARRLMHVKQEERIR